MNIGDGVESKVVHVSGRRVRRDCRWENVM
jgi:hypothetical protein